jgi:hypothetical protein
MEAVRSSKTSEYLTTTQCGNANVMPSFDHQKPWKPHKLCKQNSVASPITAGERQKLEPPTYDSICTVTQQAAQCPVMVRPLASSTCSSVFRSVCVCVCVCVCDLPTKPPRLRLSITPPFLLTLLPHHFLHKLLFPPRLGPTHSFSLVASLLSTSLSRLFIHLSILYLRTSPFFSLHSLS